MSMLEFLAVVSLPRVEINIENKHRGITKSKGIAEDPGGEC